MQLTNPNVLHRDPIETGVSSVLPSCSAVRTTPKLSRGRTARERNAEQRIVRLLSNIGQSAGILQVLMHVLRICWDGERKPSVEVPIGDFFGIGFGFTEKTSSALMNIDQRRGSITDPAASGAARSR